MKLNTKLALSLLALAAFSTAACSHSASRDSSNRTSQAAARVGAEEYTSISFDKGSSALSESDRAKLREMAQKAQSAGKVDEYKVLAWADKEFPAEGQKASRADIDLAKARAENIRKFLEDDLRSDVDVEKYNMAERPGTVSNFFGTSDSRVKNTFESTGAAPNDVGPRSTVIGNKASQALILVDYKD